MIGEDGAHANSEHARFKRGRSRRSGGERLNRLDVWPEGMRVCEVASEDDVTGGKLR